MSEKIYLLNPIKLKDLKIIFAPKRSGPVLPGPLPTAKPLRKMKNHQIIYTKWLVHTIYQDTITLSI